VFLQGLRAPRMAYDPAMPSNLAGWLSALVAWIAACAAGVAAFAQEAPKPADELRAVPSGRQAGRIAVLPISGPIDQVSLWSFERRLKAVQEGAYDALVIELDTPGGEVEATLDICLRIKSDAPANTVAWIHPKAYSAGTLIALACRELVVSPGSVFGDAAPITVMPGLGVQPLPAAERAKFESPLLDELDAAATKRGDDPRLLHAFVVTERELWLIERTADGVRRFADRDELKLLGLEPAAAITAPKDLPQRRASTPTELPLTEADRGAWRVLETVDSDSRLLVAQSDEAIRWGLAADTVKDDAALKSFFAAKELVRFPENWAETLVRFLVSWPIRIILIGIFVVALVIEGLHPGVGVAGGIAAGAMLLLIGAPALIGLAEWWEILLVLAGILLIAVEVFIIPGTGVAGIAGALCVLVGLIASFTGTDPTSATERGALITASTTTVAGLFVGGILAWFASRWFRETAVFRRAVLSASATGAIEQPSRHAPTLPATGTICVADTDLRPSGRCEHNGELFDAQSTGEYIPRGDSVRVVGRMGSSLMVERADDAKGGTA
jgi:membrane-bound serine protease (ClpP class)